MRYLKCRATNWRYKLDRLASRPLTVEGKQKLRRDMVESSAWARAELKRRREEKTKQNAENGTNNGTATLVEYRVGIIQLSTP